MVEQKVLITKSQLEINNLIDRGWLVKLCVAQHISSGSSSSISEGNFFVLFERTTN